jgi:hypothetical protein
MALALRRIRNNRAVMLLAKRWPDNLPPPVHVSDTEVKARAVSLLRGFVMRDHEPVHACDLTPEQARDVVQRFA